MKSGRPQFTLEQNISRKYSNRVQSGKAARRIWTLANGPIPDGMEVDHINRDWSDNRLSNLRLASRSENNCNRGAFCTNSTGEKNVAWGKRDSVWIVNVKAGQRRLFHRTTNFISAVLIARMTRRLLHGDFATATP